MLLKVQFTFIIIIILFSQHICVFMCQNGSKVYKGLIISVKFNILFSQHKWAKLIFVYICAKMVNLELN